MVSGEWAVYVKGILDRLSGDYDSRVPVRRRTTDPNALYPFVSMFPTHTTHTYTIHIHTTHTQFTYTQSTYTHYTQTTHIHTTHIHLHTQLTYIHNPHTQHITHMHNTCTQPIYIYTHNSCTHNTYTTHLIPVGSTPTVSGFFVGPPDSDSDTTASRVRQRSCPGSVLCPPRTPGPPGTTFVERPRPGPSRPFTSPLCGPSHRSTVTEVVKGGPGLLRPQ